MFEYEQTSQSLFPTLDPIDQESLEQGPILDQLHATYFNQLTNLLNGKDVSMSMADDDAFFPPAQEYSSHSATKPDGQAEAPVMTHEAFDFDYLVDAEKIGSQEKAPSLSTRESSKDNISHWAKKTAIKRKASYNEAQTRNIVNNVLRKAAREFAEDSSSQDIVRHKLLMLGIDFSEFQAFLKKISIRYSTSSRDLLWIYLAPKLTDKKYHLKRIFAEYFMFYLENYLPVGLVQERQIKNRQLYIKYSRHCLSYLAQAGKKERSECQDQETFEKLGQF